MNSSLDVWVAIAQIVSALVNTGIVVVMVWYTLETRRLRVTGQLQHQREWSVDYYFSAKKFGDNLFEAGRFEEGQERDALLYIGNLGRRSIVISGVWIEVLSPRADFGPASQRIAPIVLGAGQIAEVPLSTLLMAHLRVSGHIDETVAVEETAWSGAIKIAPKIHGVDVNHQHFRIYHAEVKGGRVVALPLLPTNLEWKEGTATLFGDPDKIFYSPRENEKAATSKQ